MTDKVELKTMREAAAEAGVTYDGIVQALRSGRIRRFVKIGNRNFFYPDDIAAYKAQREARHAK